MRSKVSGSLILLIFSVLSISSISSGAMRDTVFLADVTTDSTLGWLQRPFNLFQYPSINQELGYAASPLLINGIPYTKGIGMAIPVAKIPAQGSGVINYSLAGLNYTTFHMEVGIDDITPGNDSTAQVTFVVSNELGIQAQTTTPLALKDSYQFDLNIVGWKSLTIRAYATSGTGGITVDFANAYLRTGTPPVITLEDTVWLGDLNYSAYISAPTAQAPQINTNAAQPPSALTVDSVAYAKGIGVQANCELDYTIGSLNATAFHAEIGLDDIVNPNMPATVYIYNESNTLQARTQTFYGKGIYPIDVDITGWKQLRIVVIGWGAMGQTMYGAKNWAVGMPHLVDINNACLIRNAPPQPSVYPKLIYVPVIFYDYRSDGSNPNFEMPGGNPKCPYTGCLVKGMIQKTLDSDRKPILHWDSCANDQIARWWRPEGTNSTNATFVFDATTKTYRWLTGLQSYNNPSYPGDQEWVGVNYNASDPMANIVIYDSLPFDHCGNGIYEIHSIAFFPLDNKGFGPIAQNSENSYDSAALTHNYGFAMEIHQNFIYRKGLKFNFTGDDDVWAFVNDSLRMDLGGIHDAQGGTIKLDSIGLLNNHRYNFDMFYCERNPTGSDILIQTNLFAPTDLEVDTVPGIQIVNGSLAVKAGTPTAVLTALVKNDQDQLDTNLSKLVKWEIISAKLPGDTILNAIGNACILESTHAYEIIKIKASFTDPTTGVQRTIVEQLLVLPGPAVQVYIENIKMNGATPVIDTIVNPLNDTARVGSVYMDSVTQTYTLYAVLRDAWGAWIGTPATQVVWSSASAMATVAPATGWTTTVSRGASNKFYDTTYIRASAADIAKSDSVRLIIDFFFKVTPAPKIDTSGVQITGTIDYFQRVTAYLTDTADAAIYYCINYAVDPSNIVWPITNTDPRAGLVRYNPGDSLLISSIKLTNDTIRAVARMLTPAPEQDTIARWSWSRVVTAVFIPQTKKVAKPVILAAGTMWKDTVFKGVDSLLFKEATDSTYIRYTLDGSDPDSNSAVFYPNSSPAFRISNPGPTTIKAIAYHVNNALGGWLPSDMLTQTFVNLDSQGPYIKSARLFLGNLLGQTSNNPDTLVIDFDDNTQCSEITTSTLATIFNYYSTATIGRTTVSVFGTGNVQQLIDTCNDGVTGSITLLIGAHTVVPVADSIQIGNGALQDQWANPAPVNGIKCQIVWGRDYDWLMAMSPNPFNPDQEPSDLTKQYLNDVYDNLDISNDPQNRPRPTSYKYVIIRITSVKNVDPYKTRMVVYDALGNIVAELPAFGNTRNENEEFLLWDGRNKNLRMVGSGTYLAFIYFRAKGDLQDAVRTQKIAIRH